ncbi:cytochrome c oxidase subunit 1 [Striga asiatica]|uniref:Cytochrome c oxidase subunit 1 n=1 Tax=Striga asiatica TaxID=4170 RepID=A0A5A7QNZ9_STRAF|nr:cytochrome c oxidase subunit 1 [Striga asiatica]
MFISGFLPRSSQNGVSKTESAGNQRHKSSLVGTSETTRATTYPSSFCEWLAGIIDGDGSMKVSKKGYTYLEITMGLEDLPLLRYIQHMLGGSIKMRAGAKAYRYRLHKNLGMIKLMNCINGHIRHSARLLQLHRVCQVLEIPVILPITRYAQSNWFAGFFDADGTISIAMKHGLPQLSIRVTNKLLQDVESYKVVFGGSLYFDSSQNGYYQWSIQSRKDVIMMRHYFFSNTFRSHKSRRFFLIEEYYSLYDLKAFKPDRLSGMPRRIPDYPDAYAGWNALSSFGSYISVVGICRFFVVVTITSSSGKNKRCAPSPWAVEQNPTTPEWMVQSPPAFHTFGELPAIKETKSYVQ